MTKDKVAIVAGCTMITLLLFGYSAYLFSNASKEADNPEKKQIVKQDIAAKELPVAGTVTESISRTVSDTFQVDIKAVRARYNKVFGKRESDSTLNAIVVQEPVPVTQVSSSRAKTIQKPELQATRITTKKDVIIAEKAEPKKTIRKRSGLGSTLVFDKKVNNPNSHKENFTSLQIAAEIPIKVNFQEGTTIPIRTLGSCSIDGKQYPSGTKLVAVGRITKNRILLNVESLILDNSTQHVALKVYATDGILGLPYDSGDDRFSEAGSTAMGQVIRQINLPVLGTVSIPRKQKKTILEMPAGYPIYLKP